MSLSSMPLWMAQARAAALGLVAGTAATAVALLSRPAKAPPPLQVQVGNTRPLPGRDLSPASAPGSVKLARVQPGRPAAPPVPVPRDVAPLGPAPATTVTVPGATPDGRFVLHTALFPTALGDRRLAFRTMAWGEDGQGHPLRLGDPVQVDAPRTVVELPAPPSPPAWRVGPLLALEPPTQTEGPHLRAGAVVSWQKPASCWGVTGVLIRHRVGLGITVSF